MRKPRRVIEGTPSERGAKLLKANRRRGLGKLYMWMDQWYTRDVQRNDLPNTLQGTRRR